MDKKFAWICLFSFGFHTLDLRRGFGYSFQIRRHEKFDVHGKMFDTINLAFTKEGTFSYTAKKNAFCFNKECFIGPQNQ